jgi:PHD/YefM family antitoxin component YafN of YafNO toxin-antitoxin module
MKQYNAAHFRRNMSAVFNECEVSSEPVLITTRKDGRDEPQQMVIISKAQYDMMNYKLSRVK